MGRLFVFPVCRLCVNECIGTYHRMFGRVNPASKLSRNRTTVNSPTKGNGGGNESVVRIQNEHHLLVLIGKFKRFILILCVDVTSNNRHGKEEKTRVIYFYARYNIIFLFLFLFLRVFYVGTYKM